MKKLANKTQKSDDAPIRKDIGILKTDIKDIKENMYTKKDHANFIEHLFAVMATKDDIAQLDDRLRILTERIPKDLPERLDAIMNKIQLSRLGKN